MCAVLIVDDNAADRALFRILLTRAGFDVLEVAYGRDVLPGLRQHRPDAVILDVNLPDMDGHEVCRRIRGDSEWAGLPVLMLTVRDNETDVLAGLEAGADDYVPKDAPPEVFLARVRRLVRYRQLSRVAALNEGLVQVGRLLAGIVHEIRGPVSVIRGNAEILRMEHPQDEPLLDRVEPIIRGCQLLQIRLEHLMAAVRSGPPVLDFLELSPLVTEVADLFRSGTDSRAHSVEIRLACPGGLPPVRADAGRLMQVLLNLLGNSHEAIAGSTGSGRITLRVGIDRHEDRDWATIRVEDDGPGIPEEQIGRIFEPFFTTKAQGSGFGLYLSNEIVREHGGQLTAHNLPGGGACMTVWLPLDDSAMLIVSAP